MEQRATDDDGNLLPLLEFRNRLLLELSWFYFEEEPLHLSSDSNWKFMEAALDTPLPSNDLWWIPTTRSVRPPAKKIS